MIKLLLNRLLQIIPTLLVVVTITFVLTRMIPGDPVTAMVGEQADPAIMEQIRIEMGLNDPIPVQYGRYIRDIAGGDFGKSYYYNLPALQVIAERLPNTLVLSVTSILIAIVLGIVFGVVSAVKRYGFWDNFLTVVSLFGISAPVFWVGIMLVLLFSVNLGWLPTYGMGSLSDGLGVFLKHMILPTACLTIYPTATFTRITRSSMIDALSSGYINSLRAKGINERSIIWRHGLKNALPPIVTVIGMQFATTFAGAVLTETIFAWPGMGTMISGAIDNRDYALIQATVLVVAIAFVGINLITDLIYMVINPKIGAEARKGGA